MKYGWGVDGLGRQHVCREDGREVLICVLPGCHVLDCIELLKEQEEEEQNA